MSLPFGYIDSLLADGTNNLYVSSVRRPVD